MIGGKKTGIKPNLQSGNRSSILFVQPVPFAGTTVILHRMGPHSPAGDLSCSLDSLGMA